MESADVELNEAHRFVVESRCFSQVSGIVDANLPVALHAGKFGRESPHGLDERPCGNRQSKKNDVCNWLEHQTMAPNVLVNGGLSRTSLDLAPRPWPVRSTSS